MGKNKKSKNKKNIENKKNNEIRNNENKNNKNIIKFIKKFFVILGAIVPLISLFIAIKNYYREEKILEPKFSLEKNENEDGTLTLRIFNSGGTISNAIVYPTMYVTLSYYDEKSDNDIEVMIDILGYYNDENYYNSTDKAFYVKDDKCSELNEFIKIYTHFLYDDEVLAYNIIPCFTLNYTDSKGNDHNKIYKVTNKDFLNDNAKCEIRGDNFLQIQELDKKPSPDIVAPLKFEETCVISEYYENGEIIKNLIENEQDYYDCLFSSILEIFDYKIVQPEE